MAFEQLEPDPAEWTMHLTASLVALFHNVYRSEGESPFAPIDFLPGGDRRKRLAQGTALIAQFAAYDQAKRKEPN